MQARLIPAMPAEQYHRDPAPEPSLSASVAKILLSRCPLEAWRAHPKLNPGYVEESSEKFDIGTVAHGLLLEGDGSRIVSVDADDWRTKAAREKRDEARAAGKIAVLARQLDDVRAMVDAARAFVAASEIKGIFDGGASEQTILWREEDAGCWCRARLDWLSADRRLVLDYKTTGDVAPDVFCRQIPSLGYQVQDAFYRRAVMALGEPNPAFVFLAQSTEAPFDCALFACDPMLRQIGEWQVEQAITQWGACLKSGRWPGYGGRIHYAAAPSWLQWANPDAMGEIHG